MIQVVFTICMYKLVSFRRGRGCVDQIFTIRQLSEKVLEKNKQMVIACIDLEKAYDKVSRDSLWQVLESYGIQGGLLRAIQSMYLGSRACVRTSGKVSGWFPRSEAGVCDVAMAV